MVAIIGLIATIALPEFLKPKDKTRGNLCIYNLKQIDGAKEQWAFENNKYFGKTPKASDLNPYISSGTDRIHCPVDKKRSFKSSYKINKITKPPSCKILPAEHQVKL